MKGRVKVTLKVIRKRILVHREEKTWECYD